MDDNFGVNDGDTDDEKGLEDDEDDFGGDDDEMI